MIVGNGMIAKRFSAYTAEDNVVIFASGVSNSKETAPEAFQREKTLLSHTLASASEQLFVYFSTCSINDPTEKDSQYVAHKLEVEKQIAEEASSYLIFRTSNVVGGNYNPHTILNFFFRRIQEGTSFDIWNGATRNLIDLDDVYEMVQYFITDASIRNQVINIANPYNTTPLQIVRTIEEYLQKTGSYRILEKGEPFMIDTDRVKEIFIRNNPTLTPEGYTLKLLEKYY